MPYIFVLYLELGGGTHAFKFKRFGVPFQAQSFCCSFFFSVVDFFSRTKSFIDIDIVEQLTFFITFVDQLRFQPVIHFWFINVTAWKWFVLQVWQMYFIFDQLSLFLTTGQNVLSSCHFCVDRFFEQFQFEQFNLPR